MYRNRLLKKIEKLTLVLQYYSRRPVNFLISQLFSKQYEDGISFLVAWPLFFCIYIDPAGPPGDQTVRNTL